MKGVLFAGESLKDNEISPETISVINYLQSCTYHLLYSIELTVHTSCYCVLDLLCVTLLTSALLKRPTG